MITSVDNKRIKNVSKLNNRKYRKERIDQNVGRGPATSDRKGTKGYYSLLL